MRESPGVAIFGANRDLAHIDLARWSASLRIIDSGRNAAVAEPIEPNPICTGLDAVDHVVVLMMENRSFDNVLGYLYPDGVPANAPLGKVIDGLLFPDGSAKPLFNPIPDTAVNKPDHGLEIVKAGPVDPGNFRQPYPDPGEEYPYINIQLFNQPDGDTQPPYNLPPGTPAPTMDGFITDYIRNFKEVESAGMDPNKQGRDPTYEEYRQIMQCYTPAHLPVITTLAREFAVFDHWHCAVPSQTFCNRAFWHAGTSWGRVINDPMDEWSVGSDAPTLFNQFAACDTTSGLDWKIYSGNSVHFFLTGVIHPKALAPFTPPFGQSNGYMQGMAEFLSDCAAGTLPSYSFIEPQIYGAHNDMHPSSTTGKFDADNADSPVTLGEALIWDVYEAIRCSACAAGSNAMNTLLIITFDEHGGTYDHVPPPPAVAPDLNGNPAQDGFDFKRLGVRVPIIMVSARIAANTVVNTPMDHCSFMATLRHKWEAAAPGKFPPLTARVEAAAEFGEVFTAQALRKVCDWPLIPRPVIGPPSPPPSGTPLNHLQQSCAAAVAHLAAAAAISS